ncbi:MAG: hypothetical protein AABY22_16780 [Nanoarchaeota archaeon]
MTKIISIKDCMNKTKENKNICESFRKIPEYSKTKFFISPSKNEIITGNKIDLGRNICIVRIGEYATKERKCDIGRLKSIYYPEHKEISLFDEMSYHGAKSQGEGKITNYGTKDYNLQYTKLTPKIKAKFTNPVKTETKTQFFKEISEIDLNQKDYVVLNWIPKNDKILLQVKQTRESPMGEKENVFESKEFNLSNKEEAIKIFKERVETLK